MTKLEIYGKNTNQLQLNFLLFQRKLNKINKISNEAKIISSRKKIEKKIHTISRLIYVKIIISKHYVVRRNCGNKIENYENLHFSLLFMPSSTSITVNSNLWYVYKVCTSVMDIPVFIDSSRSLPLVFNIDTTKK